MNDFVKHFKCSPNQVTSNSKTTALFQISTASREVQRNLSCGHQRRDTIFNLVEMDRSFLLFEKERNIILRSEHPILSRLIRVSNPEIGALELIPTLDL